MPVVKTAERMLLQFRSAESANAVSRRTVRKMAALLGFNETETTLFALARLRDQLLPAYEPDEGPLSAKVIQAIKDRVPQDDFQPTKSLFDGA
jgi:hypothetical protein